MVELSSNASRKGFYVAVLPALPFLRVCGSAFIDVVPVGLAPVDRYSKITSYCHLFWCDLRWRWKDD